MGRGNLTFLAYWENNSTRKIVLRKKGGWGGWDKGEMSLAPIHEKFFSAQPSSDTLDAEFQFKQKTAKGWKLLFLKCQIWILKSCKTQQLQGDKWIRDRPRLKGIFSSNSCAAPSFLKLHLWSRTCCQHLAGNSKTGGLWTGIFTFQNLHHTSKHLGKFLSGNFFLFLRIFFFNTNLSLNSCKWSRMEPKPQDLLPVQSTSIRHLDYYSFPTINETAKLLQTPKIIFYS